MRCRRMMFPVSIWIKVMRERLLVVGRKFQPGWRSLTTAAHKPSIISERVTSSYSFRFPELSQPI
jgi:hypothetical protein